MKGGEGSPFGKYFLLKRIATGGMGEIYLAKLKGPEGFEKLLVIKRILQHHTENQDFVDMFFAEARVAAQLSNSNVVQIYEMGEIESSYYIAMEYIHGKSLRDTIDRARELGEPIPAIHALSILSKAISGMGYAHSAKNMGGEHIGIIHRDLNPHNILVSYTGEVKIIDFGIAKSEMAQHKTETGTIKGKFVYMSPEQSAAQKLDRRSDVFSLGICLYETLTGSNPFARANVVLSLDAIQRKDPSPIAEFNHRLAPIQPILDKALSKDREDRYPDCGAFLEDLQRLILSGELQKPAQSLDAYMNYLFEEKIAEENRLIVETDSTSSMQLDQMRSAAKNEHHSGPHENGDSNAAATAFAPSPVAATMASPQAMHSDSISVEAIPTDSQSSFGTDMARVMVPRSRSPFYALLVAIILLTTAAVVALNRMGPTPPAEIAANVPVEPAPDPEPSPEPAPEEEKPTPHESITKEPAPKEPAKVSKLKRPKPKITPSVRPQKKPTSLKSPPPAPTPPPEPSFGNMQISASPPVRITLSGKKVGQTIKLRNNSGTLILGTGRNSFDDPFVIKVRYKVSGTTITYALDANPWAIVRGKGGIGLGKTPLSAREHGHSSVFEFVNPKLGLRQRLNLRFSAP